MSRIIKRKPPFTLYHRKTSPCFYVRFRDELTGEYGKAISTRARTKREAIRIAYQWLAEGIPSQKDAGGGETSRGAASVLSALRRADLSSLSESDKEKIVKALKKDGVIKSAVVSGSAADVRFIDFLLSIWDWDSSEYVREKQRAGHSLHKRHVLNNRTNIKKYWLPFFGDMALGEVTRETLRRFLDSLAEYKLSNGTKNRIFLAGATALRWAYAHESIPENIAAEKTFILYSAKHKPRKILTHELMRAVLSVEWNDTRSKTAFFISAFAGMRAGEIQALRLQDLGENCFYVNHSFNTTDGLKSPKNGEARTVYFPFPNIIDALKEMAYQNPHGDCFVFWGVKPNRPLNAGKWLIDFRDALVKTGTMTAEEAKQYCFHGQRHFFTANMQAAGTADRVLQQQTGHKTLAMLEHYASHETDFDRQMITQGQKQLYNAVFPGGETPAANVLQTAAPDTRKINREAILARLPPPQSADPLDALEQAGLIQGGTIATDKGLAICAAYLLHYGLACEARTLAKIRKENGEEYGTAVAGATVRKIARKTTQA